MPLPSPSASELASSIAFHPPEHITNDPKGLVIEALKGLVTLNPNVQLNEQYKGPRTRASNRRLLRASLDP